MKGDSSRARPVSDAARGESGGIGSIASSSEARRPYSNQRCGCEQSEQTEGLHRDCSCLRQPLSQTFGLPAPRSGSLWVQYKLSVQCRTPSRSDRFNGVTGGAGGPKGRNRNLPWPPCKKVIKTKKSPLRSSFHYLLIFISSRSRCLCRGRTGPRRGHSPRAGSCCRNSRGNSSRSSSRSRGRSPWGRCRSGTW